jgi:predicted alpha-1,6-mannanase (GH76 family)
MSRGWLTPRAAIIPAVGTAVALSLTAITGPAADAASAVNPALTAAASITVSPQQAGVDEMMKSYGLTRLIGTSWWQAAIAQSTLETYEQDTGDTTYSGDIADTYDLYHLIDPSLQPDFEDHFIDDTGWWGVAWLQAYLLTGDSSYLQTAEADVSYMHQYWNTDASACGGVGGVWWEVTSSGPTGRVAISNELFLELSAWLYNVTGNATYLSWAEAEWSWFSQTGFITSSNLVLDNYESDTDCQLIAPYFTYNQGVILAGLGQLYLATKNASLLTEAENIATAAIAHLAPTGVLADTCQPSSCDGDMTSFKGIFVRNLRMLATIAGTSQYNSFLSAQAASIEAHDTNGSSQMGLNWSASVSACPSALTTANPCNSQTQVAAEDALVAALGPPVARPAAVVDPDGTVWAFARAAGGGTGGGSLEADSLAKGATSWSGFTSLGGSTPYGPAAVATSAGDTRVFVVSANGNLYNATLKSGTSTWSGWVSLGTPGGLHLIGTPAVVQDNNVIRVFVRGENGNLYTDTLTGSTWSGYTDLSGTWPSDVAALVGSGGYVHVFAVGTTGNLYHDQLPPGGSWSGWGDLGGQVTGVPAVTQDSAGTIRAYARQVSGGGLLEYYADKGSTSYPTDTHNGAWPYDEATVATSGTRAVSVFGVGTNGNAYYQYLTTAPSWSGWNDLAGTFTGVPAAVSLGSGDIDLFADSGGSLEVNQLSGSTWSGWTALGGNLS